jgi:2-methylisocitrate lyase-like PEP mutase family enzyme
MKRVRYAVMSSDGRLRALVAAPQILVAPGCFDALTAGLIEHAGFGAAYLSGASIAYTRFGRPDIGLISMSEVAQTIAVIRERTTIPLIVDADTGFGNALNTQRTVRLFERMGASGIQLEDQLAPKRCGHLDGKRLVSTGEMAGKLRAACDARSDRDTLIIARTDALAAEGLDAALDRAERYLEAGADLLFVEALQNEADMRSAAARFRNRAPLLVNMVEGGKTPIENTRVLEELGFAVVIYPGSLVRALSFAAIGLLGSLKRDGDTLQWSSRMLAFADLQKILGTDELLAAGRRYDEAEEEGRS